MEKGKSRQVLKSGQALFYQGYWKNIGLMMSKMQMKLGCITEPLLMTLAYIEENILNPSSTAIDISSKISILQAVSFVAKSWWAVK